MSPQKSFPPSVVGSPLRFASTPPSPLGSLSSTAPRPYPRVSPKATLTPGIPDSIENHITDVPPRAPMTWSWVCHKCSTRFPLGTTQRCLFDDHQVCFGRPIRPSSRKKSLACGTEFDYTGWQEWLTWRKNKQVWSASSSMASLSDESTMGSRDCWTQCSYPSECRWKARDLMEVAKDEEGVHPMTSLTIDLPLALSALTTDAKKIASTRPRLQRTASAPALSPISEEALNEPVQALSCYSLPALDFKSFEALFRQIPVFSTLNDTNNGAASVHIPIDLDPLKVDRQPRYESKDAVYDRMNASKGRSASASTSTYGGLKAATLVPSGSFDDFDFGFGHQNGGEKHLMPMGVRRNARDWTAGTGTLLPGAR